MPRSRQPSDLVSLKSGAQCSGELPHLWVPLKAGGYTAVNTRQCGWGEGQGLGTQEREMSAKECKCLRLCKNMQRCVLV